VCLLVTFVNPAKTAKLIEVVLDADSGGPKEPFLYQMQVHRGRVVGPILKHCNSEMRNSG